ncbi:hypothetical protein [Bacillus testis]|uniref:hypothetical protein n=1 Tax=Bacillus testis TaxID=1622072 RepID=UPI000AE14461|nr:hypothetical protein [Bacillus testis]
MINQTHDFQCILKAISNTYNQLQAIPDHPSEGERRIEEAKDDASRALIHLLMKKGYQ